MRAGACASDGSALPWFTYPAIDFLAQRSFRDKNVLEFGGGQSTLWWASRSKFVWTIEEDFSWYQKLKAKIPENVQLMYNPIDSALRRIDDIEHLLDSQSPAKFDVIVIDGHLRAEALGIAFRRLSKDGFILFDNAEGYGFFRELQKFPCSRIDFFGFAPGVLLRHCTSMMFVDTCFLLAPNIPIPNIELL